MASIRLIFLRFVMISQLLLFSGCRENTDADAVGIYRFEKGTVTMELDLDEGGKFKQRNFLKGSLYSEGEGTWRLIRDNIFLEGYLGIVNCDEEFTGATPPSNAGPSFSRFPRRLIVFCELSVYFSRID